MNTFTVVGRLGRDPEIRQLDNGIVATLSVAESNYVKGHEVTNWWRCYAFGKTAEVVEKWMKKGQEVVIDGRLRQREYDKDGFKQTVTEVMINNIQMVGGKPQEKREPSRYDIREERRQEQVNTSDVPF